MKSIGHVIICVIIWLKVCGSPYVFKCMYLFNCIYHCYCFILWFGWIHKPMCIHVSIPLLTVQSCLQCVLVQLRLISLFFFLCLRHFLHKVVYMFPCLGLTSLTLRCALSKLMHSFTSLYFLIPSRHFATGSVFNITNEALTVYPNLDAMWV